MVRIWVSGNKAQAHSFVKGYGKKRWTNVINSNEPIISKSAKALIDR